MTRTPLTIDRLPLFADDQMLGEAILGRRRAREFSGIASLYESRGMPKISPVWGGRYVKAVLAFLDSNQGILDAKPPLREDGIEGKWNSSKNDRRVRA